MTSRPRHRVVLRDRASHSGLSQCFSSLTAALRGMVTGWLKKPTRVPLGIPCDRRRCSRACERHRRTRAPALEPAPSPSLLGGLGGLIGENRCDCRLSLASHTQETSQPCGLSRPLPPGTRSSGSLRIGSIAGALDPARDGSNVGSRRLDIHSNGVIALRAVSPPNWREHPCRRR